MLEIEAMPQLDGGEVFGVIVLGVLLLTTLTRLSANKYKHPDSQTASQRFDGAKVLDGPGSKPTLGEILFGRRRSHVK